MTASPASRITSAISGVALAAISLLASKASAVSTRQRRRTACSWGHRLNAQAPDDPRQHRPELAPGRIVGGAVEPLPGRRSHRPPSGRGETPQIRHGPGLRRTDRRAPHRAPPPPRHRGSPHRARPGSWPRGRSPGNRAMRLRRRPRPSLSRFSFRARPGERRVWEAGGCLKPWAWALGTGFGCGGAAFGFRGGRLLGPRLARRFGGRFGGRLVPGLRCAVFGVSRR